MVRVPGLRHPDETLICCAMKEFHFQAEQWLPHPVEEVFAFFSEARNLEKLTPPWLRFEVLTPAPIAMQAGTLIDYRIRVHGLPIHWRTEIVEWNPPHRFVDVQLRGPYTLWHHTHIFGAHAGGTLCHDQVRYRPRGGALMNWLFVRRDVSNIFGYRSEKMIQIFRKNSVSTNHPIVESLANRRKPVNTGSQLTENIM
jgi:ligand-binding SRPBCC domain-containing protein